MRIEVELAFDPSGLGSGTARARVELDKLGDQSERAAKRVSSALKNIVGALALREVGQATMSFFRRSIEEAVEAEHVFAQLEATVRATGGAAGFTAPQLMAMAEGFARVSTYEDDVIAAGEDVLLTFRNIGHDVFPQAAQAALDLAAKTGGDLRSAFELVGKALDKPEAGARLLRQAHINLSEAQQATIKDLVRTGDAAGAQAIILGELEARYEGSALAARDTLGGALAVLENALSEVYEAAGEELSPALKELANDLTGTSVEAENARRSAENFGRGMGQTAAGIVQGGRWILSTYNEIRGALAILQGAAITAAAGILDAFLGLAQGAYNALGRLPGVVGERFREASRQIAAERRGWVQSLRELGEGFVDVGVEQFLLDERKAAEAVREVGEAANRTTPELTGLTKEQEAAANKAQKLAEHQREVVAELKREAEAAEARFRLVGASNAAILQQDIAEAKLAATLKLGKEATASMVSEAQRYAERAVIAKNATENWAAALRDLDAASSARVNAQFEENVRRLGADRTVYELGIAIDPKVVEGIFQQIRDEARATAEAIKAAGLTIVEQYKLQKAEVERLMRLGELTAEEGARALLNLERQRWDDTLAAADSALGYLAARFGGFFSYLSQLMNAVQGARAFGQSVTQVAQGVSGSTAAWTSTLGAVAGVFAFYYEVYKLVSDHVKRQRLKKFGTDARFELSDGIENHSFFHGKEKELVNALRDVVRSVEQALGVMVTDLEEIGIRVRNDGKKAKAYLHGILLGEFNDINEAIEVAMLAAFKDPNTRIRGLSELMRQGLSRVHIADLDELTRFLQQLRAISDLRMPQGAVAIRNTVMELEKLWLALQRLRDVTPEVRQGFADLVATEVDAWTQWRNRLTGHEASPEEQLAMLQREAQIFNAQKALRIKELEFRKLELQQDVERLRLRAQIGGTGGRIGQILLQQQSEELKVRYALAAAGQTLLESQVAMLDAMLEAIDDLIAALAAIPDIDWQNLKLPRIGRGGVGGGANDGREGVLQALEDAALRRLPELQQRLEEVNRTWAEHSRAAGKDAELLRQIAQARQEEREQILAEALAGAAERRAQFLGEDTLVAQIRAVNASASDLVAEYRELWRAGGIARVTFREIRLELQRVARERGLQIVGSAATSLITELYGYLGEEEKSAQLRFDLTVAELQVKREQLALAYQELGLETTALGLIDQLIARVVAAGPAIFEAASRGAAEGERISREEAIRRDRAMVLGEDDSAERIADALRQLEEIESLGLDPLRRDLAELDDTFRGLREVLGDNERVQRAYGLAVRDVMDRYLQPVRQLYDSLNLSEFSPLDAWERLAEARVRAQTARSAFRAGDLSVIEDIPDLVQQLFREAQSALPTGTLEYANMFREWNSFLREVLAIGTPAAGGGLPGAAAGGAAAGAPLAPVVDAVQIGAADTTAELRGLRRTVETLAADVRAIRVESERGILREAS